MRQTTHKLKVTQKRSYDGEIGQLDVNVQPTHTLMESGNRKQKEQQTNEEHGQAGPGFGLLLNVQVTEH